MGVVTDPAILAQLNGGGAPAPRGPVYGAPPKAPAPPSSYDQGRDSRSDARDARKDTIDAQKFQAELYTKGLRMGQNGPENIPGWAPPPKAGQLSPGAAYPQSALDAFDRAIGSAGRLKDHPGYGAAVGSGFDPAAIGSYNPISGKALGGTNAAGFEAQLSAMKAQVFLPMVQSMKGMGALSNAEGEKLTAAIGALDTSMPEEEFRQSLDRIVGDLTTYRNRGAVPQPGAPDAAALPTDANAFDQAATEESQGKPNNVPVTGKSADTYDAAVSQEALGMHQQGKSIDEINAMMAARGMTPFPHALTPQQLNYSKQNPRWNPFQAYHYRDTTLRERAAASPVASYASAAGNALTAGLQDEIYGAGAAALGGDYTQARDSFDRNKKAVADLHPLADLAGNVTGGALLAPIGGAALSKVAPGIAPAIMSGLRANPVKAATAYSAAYGAGENNDNRVAGAAIGGALGAGAGGLVKYAPRALSSLSGKVAPSADDAATIAAMQRQDIPVRRADIDPSVRGKLGALGQSEKAGPLVKEAAASDREAIQGKLADLGGKPYTDNVAMGQMVQRTLKRQKVTSAKQRGAMYDDVETLAPGFKAKGAQTMAHIDEEIARMKATAPRGNGAIIKVLEGVKADLKDTGLSVPSMQAIRKTARDRIGAAGLDFDAHQGMFSGITRTAGKELKDSLRTANPDASALLSRANAKTAQQHRFREEVGALFLGSKGNATPEEAARTLESIVRNKGNTSALKRFKTAANPEDFQDAAATIVQRVGSNSKGDFSLPLFVAAVDPAGKGAISQRTLNTVFGKEGVAAINDLRLAAKAKISAQDGANSSNSGGLITRGAAGVRSTMLAALGFSTGGVGGAIAAPLAERFVKDFGEKRAAKALLDPNLAKWVRNLPRDASTADTDRHFARLFKMVAKQPGVLLAKDIADLKQAFHNLTDDDSNAPAPASNK